MQRPRTRRSPGSRRNWGIYFSVPKCRSVGCPDRRARRQDYRGFDVMEAGRMAAAQARRELTFLLVGKAPYRRDAYRAAESRHVARARYAGPRSLRGVLLDPVRMEDKPGYRHRGGAVYRTGARRGQHRGLAAEAPRSMEGRAAGLDDL